VGQSRTPTENTGFLLQRAHRRLRGLMNEALVPFELHIAHVAVLSLLWTNPSLSQRQLIEVLEIDKSTMVHLIDELERREMVERQADPRDRRAYAVRMTGIGRERFPVLGKIVADVETRFLKPLSGRDREALNGLLSKLCSTGPVR
jgi:DNA-binding MarR family transcriptional regulator